jgi:hypothetical protein
MGRTNEWVEYLNTAVICAVLVLAVATVIGVYTRPTIVVGSAAPVGSLPAGSLPAGPVLSGDAVDLNHQAAGRELVIPMGFYYGTFVMHCWIRTYDRPFRMRVDTGSSVMLFGDLPGCIDGSNTVCSTEAQTPVASDTVEFGETLSMAVRTTTIAPRTVTFGFIDGNARVEPSPLRVRVADNSRAFVMPLGFAGGKDGLMNQLNVRRLQVWMVQESWSIRMPCQLVLSPRMAPNVNLTILEAPLVSKRALVAALSGGATDAGGAAAGSITERVVPTYVFRVQPPPAPSPVARTLEYAIIDIGSTLSYVPLDGHDKVLEDVVLAVPGAGRSITLSKEETIPLTSTVSLNRNLGGKVVVIGNRALNHLVLDIDLDDGPTGMLRLMRPS